MGVTILAYSADNELSVYESMDGLAQLKPTDSVWVDIETDDVKELEQVAEHFDFHELSVEDCLTPGHLPKLDDYGAYLFMIVRGLKSWSEVEELWEKEDEEHGEELDDDNIDHFTRKVAVYLADKFVVTYRRREVAWLDALVRQVQQYPQRLIGEGTDVVAHRVIDVLIDRFLRGMSFFDKIIDKFEEVAIESPDGFEVSDLLDLKHKLTSLRQVMRNQRGVVSRLASEASLIQEKQRRRYFKDIDDHALQLLALIDRQISNILSIRDSYIAMANVRLGDTMRILTVITTIAAPMNLVVGLYGMNFSAIPLLHNPYGFWFIISLMFLLAIIMLVYFRTRRWI